MNVVTSTAAIASSLPLLHASSLPDWLVPANRAGMLIPKVTTSGYRCLDRELPHKGWPTAVLIELLVPQHSMDDMRLLAPTLATLTQSGKTVILLVPAHLTLAPSLTGMGLDLQNVLLVSTDKPMDRIWNIEQAMKSPRFGALLCWLPQTCPGHLRRLQLVAASSTGLCFIFRPESAQREASPAPLRITCRASRCGNMEVDIIKRRGPVFGKPVVLPLPVTR